MKVRWSETAANALLDIYEYIAHDSEEAALAQVTRLIDAGDRLALHPRIGRPGRLRGTRELILAPYVLVYVVESETVDIRAVLHGSRRF